MLKYFVAFNDNTVGQVIAEYEEGVKIGQRVKITLNDENGNPIEKYGVIKEILEIKEEWE